jgi:6-phosphogluconolactonase
MLHEHLFPDPATLLPALLEFCVQALREDLSGAAQATCLLSGGSTPRPLYERLATAPLPWDRIVPALVDERWVPPQDPASNEGLLRTIFRQTPGFADRLQGMYGSAADPAAGQAACEQHYAALPQPWSLCLLGMGNDGHTASLFPSAQGLQEALTGEHLCQAISAQASTVTGAHTQRMTLTLAALAQARRLVLFFNGHDKWQVYQAALRCHDTAQLPVAAVLQLPDTPVHVFYHP